MHKLLIFGYGYTAAYIANSLDSAQWDVVGTSRSKHSLPNIIAYSQKQIRQILPTVTHIIISIPPKEYGDIVLRNFGEIVSSAVNLKWVGYLSSSAVYGDHNGKWVHEESQLFPSNQCARNRVLAEEQWLNFGKNNNVNINIFRLTAIYGPGRNAVESIQNGTAKSIFKEGHNLSRIHVDDITNIIKLAMYSDYKSEIYNIADDYPCPTYEVNNLAAELLDVEAPSMINFDQSELSPRGKEFYADNKKVSNNKIKTKLVAKLKYPTFREGLKSFIL